MLLLPVDLAVDANRDGTIVMASGSTQYDSNGNALPVDTTSQDKPFRFWINDGVDGNVVDSGTTVQEDIKPTSGNQNCQQGMITCTRDLENFARLWLYTKGLSQAISSGSIIVGLEWHSNTGDATNGWGANDGAPAINLYAAAPKHGTGTNTGGADYLTDTATANDQVNGNYGISLGTAAKGQPFYFDPSAFTGLTDSNCTTYFLFEGAARGTGRLVITFNTVSGGTVTKIGEGGTVYMDLKETQELYERWTVGDGPAAGTLTSGGGGRPSATAVISQDRLPTGATALRYSPTTPGLSVSSDPTGNDYILFVHGWNLSPWDKDAFAATMLKRLYWQGYKGKFGAFQWPTTYASDYNDFFDDLQETTIYDIGEYSAWLSATPLEGLLSQLNGQYGTNVYVLAHSMGNVVAGEALRIAGQAGVSLVNTYVASQAAVPGHCYDPTLTGTNLLDFHVPSWNPFSCGPDTPNIYNNWMIPAQTPPHLAMASKVNFYNVNDYALSYWNLDQVLKPDSIAGIAPPYGYSGDPNAAPVENGFYNTVNDPNDPGSRMQNHLHLGTVTDVKDRYEIMAYASEPRSKALGEVTTVTGFGAQPLTNGLWPTDGFQQPNGPYSAHPWHSAEFLFTNAEMQEYWNTLMVQFGLTPNPLP